MTTSQSSLLPSESGPKPLDLEKAFNRPGPLKLEVDLGCGKGRFLLARASAHRNTCFLGVDRRRPRIEKVGRAVQRSGLENVRLICAEVFVTVTNLIPENSVSTYYIFFPDPWPKRRHHRRRLFNPEFLDAVSRTLRQEGQMHVATDHLDYFSIIKNLLTVDHRWTEIEPFIPAENERTNFELVFLGQAKPIGRCSFLKKSP